MKKIIFLVSELTYGGTQKTIIKLVKRFVKEYPNYHIINLDKLTYCGDLDNVKELHQRVQTYISLDFY